MTTADHPVFDAMLVLLTVLPVADLAATAFFARLFVQSKQYDVPGGSGFWRSRLLGGRSWLLALLTVAFAITTTASAILGFIAGRRLLDLPTVEGTGPIVALMIILLGGVPVVFTVGFWRARKTAQGRLDDE